MSVAEARSEIKSLFEQAEVIEKRYPDGPITDNEDEKQVKALLSSIDELEAKLATLEDSESRKNRIMEGVNRYNLPAQAIQHARVGGDQASKNQRLSPGQQFVADGAWRTLQREGQFKSDLNRAVFAVQMKDGTSLLEWKELLRAADRLTSGGAFVLPENRPGVLDILQREITLLDLIPRLGTNSDTIQYIREDAFTNNAAFTAEATATTGTTGTKPESVLQYSTQSTTVKTLAHWIPVTNRLLDDAPAIRGIIDTRLLTGLDLTLETQVITGDGTGENFSGLLTAGSGINVQAKGSDNVIDAIFKGRTKVRVTGHARPNAVVLHPNDYETVRLLREGTGGTAGAYLMGPPSETGPTTIFGMPVVESEALTENTGLVGDFRLGISLFDREQSAIRVGTINDQFVRNMQTILAEGRWALVIWRPTAFTQVTGI